MLHALNLESIPRVSSMYKIKRQTVWQTCDQENLLVLMESGRCLFTLNGKSYTAGAGDLVFIPAGQDYKREPLDDAPAVFTYFHFYLPDAPVRKQVDECARELAELQRRLYRTSDDHFSVLPYTVYLFTVTPLSPEGQAICQQALAQYMSDHMNFQMDASLLTAYLMAYVSRDNVQRLLSRQSLPADTVLPGKLREAILYIRNHYDKPLTVSELCRNVGISRQHMNRLFHTELGVTPIQYIHHTKIMHAKDLILHNEQLSMKELAYMLGFSDEHYFSRLFARVAGKTPTQFRAHVNSYHRDDQATE